MYGKLEIHGCLLVVLDTRALPILEKDEKDFIIDDGLG